MASVALDRRLAHTRQIRQGWRHLSFDPLGHALTARRPTTLRHLADSYHRRLRANAELDAPYARQPHVTGTPRAIPLDHHDLGQVGTPGGGGGHGGSRVVSGPSNVNAPAPPERPVHGNASTQTGHIVHAHVGTQAEGPIPPDTSHATTQAPDQNEFPVHQVSPGPSRHPHATPSPENPSPSDIVTMVKNDTILRLRSGYTELLSGGLAHSPAQRSASTFTPSNPFDFSESYLLPSVSSYRLTKNWPSASEEGIYYNRDTYGMPTHPLPTDAPDDTPSRTQLFIGHGETPQFVVHTVSKGKGADVKMMREYQKTKGDPSPSHVKKKAILREINSRPAHVPSPSDVAKLTQSKRQQQVNRVDASISAHALRLQRAREAKGKQPVYR